MCKTGSLLKKISSSVWFFLFFCLFLCAEGQTARRASTQYLFPHEKALTTITSWCSKSGDSSLYASVEYVDTAWDYSSGNGLWYLEGHAGVGVYWYRSRVFLAEAEDSTEPLVVFLPVAVSAAEVYWDGILIGSSGKIGSDSTDEISGKSAQIFVVPHTLATFGEHLIALRVSNYSAVSGMVKTPLQVGYVQPVISAILTTLSLGLFLAGIFFITALFHLFLLHNSGRKSAHILFALFSFSCAGHLLITLLFDYIPIGLQWYYSTAILGDVFWFGMLALLPLYLLAHFRALFRQATAGIIIITTVTIVLMPRLAIYGVIPIESLPFWNSINQIYANLSVLVSIAIALGALIRKRQGSKTILIGLVAFFIGVQLSTRLGAVNGWAVGFAVLNIFITITVSRLLSEDRRQQHRTEIKSARLELELLKSHIQPHFLLNSLNSIVAWIEEEPPVAVKLVTALSRELRFLMSFARENRISLMQEISLCQAHLQVMNMRQEKQMSLTVEGKSEGIYVPPLILHTAIENGISHGFRKIDQGEFRLICYRDSGTVFLTLHNNGDNKQRLSETSGTGTRYILGRLEEAYGTRFTCVSEPTDTGWCISFSFPDTA